jgi:hypothetical protein
LTTVVRKYPPGFAIRFNSRWVGVAVERSVVRSSSSTSAEPDLSFVTPTRRDAL